MSSSRNVWITDGTIIAWKGTTVLDGSENPGPVKRDSRDMLAKLLEICPNISSDVFSAGTYYEGVIDKEVPEGDCTLACGQFEAEAEWVLIFKRPLTELDEPDPETECKLQGMIEGKRVDLLAKNGKIDWRKASAGNNLVAAGAGIPTQLGKIACPDSTVAGAMVMVRFEDARGREVVHAAGGYELAGFPVVDLVKAVKRLSEKQDIQVTAVNLGARGSHSAYAADESRRSRATGRATFPGILRRLYEVVSLRNPLDVVNDVRVGLFKEVIASEEYAKTNSLVELRVSDGKGAVVGKASLQLKGPGG